METSTQSWSERLRQRARELGLTDAEVARRLGLGQARYSAYVNGSREPHLELFARICVTLATTPDVILGVGAEAGDVRDELRGQILATLAEADEDTLRLVAALTAVVATQRRPSHAAPRESVRATAKARARRPKSL